MLAVLACLAALGAAVVGCGSDTGTGTGTTSPPPRPVAHVATTGTDAESSAAIFSEAMSGLWLGTTTSVSNSLITWMLGGFGAAHQESAQLSKINGELQAIQGELQTINDTLTGIENELDRQTCDTLEATSIGPYTSRLDALWIEYETLLGWKASTDTFDTDPNPSEGDIEQFIANANDAETGGYQPDGGYSLSTALTNIWTGLDPAGSGAYGVLAECIKALGNTAAVGTTDDRTYYESEVVPMEEYYYTYQLEAFEMMAEVNHYLAWQAAGAPTGNAADVADEVCGEGTSSDSGGSGESPEYLCQEVANYIYYGYEELVDQWMVGGGPYSSETLITLNGTGLLFPQSLQEFTLAQSSGASCSKPVSSEKPCGPLVGAQSMSGSISGSYEGYSGWQVASATQLNELVNPSTISGSSQADWTSGTLASWLSDRGLVDPGGPYIVVTPQTGSVLLPDDNEYRFSAICFMDTQLNYSDSGREPYCGTNSEYGEYEKLVHPVYNGGEIAWDYSPTWIDDVSYNSFYEIEFEDKYGSNWVKKNPGWRTGSTPDEYHWPVLHLSEIPCTENNPADNPAGVPSLCDGKLATYVASYVPGPPQEATAEGLQAVAPPA